MLFLRYLSASSVVSSSLGLILPNSGILKVKYLLKTLNIVSVIFCRQNSETYIDSSYSAFTGFDIWGLIFCHWFQWFLPFTSYLWARCQLPCRVGHVCTILLTSWGVLKDCGWFLSLEIIVVCSFLLVLLWFLFCFYTLSAPHYLVSFIAEFLVKIMPWIWEVLAMLCWQKINHVCHYVSHFMLVITNYY